MSSTGGLCNEQFHFKGPRLEAREANTTDTETGREVVTVPDEGLLFTLTGVSVTSSIANGPYFQTKHPLLPVEIS